MDGAAFAPPRPNHVQRRPAKIVLPSVKKGDHPTQYHKSQSGESSPTKVLLSFIPPGYRTPPYTSSSGSGGSSPSSVSPNKDDQNHFKFDHGSLNTQLGPNGVYMKNGATVQMLSLKTRRHDPPKQLLTLASHQQQNYAPSESGYSHSSQSSIATSGYSIHGAHQHNQAHDGKQRLSLRPRASSELSVQEVCAFCYQFAVHYANSRNESPLPRLTDRGYWRGHVMKEGDTIVCPRALRRVCALCGATGQNAHLNNFCPIAKKHSPSY